MLRSTRTAPRREFSDQRSSALTRDRFEFDVRPDSSESEPPIDLPLHDRAPVIEEPPPLRGTVEAAGRASSTSSGGRGIVVGVLALGLLAGFGAGFVVGQRLAPPPPPRVVEVPRPAPVIETVAPVAPVLEPPVAPVVDTPVVVREPEVQAPPPEPRIPAPASRIPASRPATIRFDSRPPGATIYLDEVRVGVTPLTMTTVTPGMHQVRMEMLGHETWRTSVTVKDGEQLFVGGSLG